MAKKLNAIQNPDFSQGRAEPAKWSWQVRSGSARWHRPQADAPECERGVVILAEDEPASAAWTQTATVKPGETYRAEATVSVHPFGPQSGGACLSVAPIGKGAETGAVKITPIVARAGEAIAIRAYYTVPKGVRRVEFSVGIEGALGRAIIHHARLIEILEVEEYSNPLATPPPSVACPPPKVAETVAIVSERAEKRPITSILRACYGDRAIQAMEPKSFSVKSPGADALLFPDAKPPRGVASMAALKRLAENRIVVISLPALAHLSRGALSPRRVSQPDDPIHAKVMMGDYSTRGFALADAFPFAWPGHRSETGARQTPCSFTQNHFRKTPALATFCKKHGLVTVLESVCNQDVTSERPACLSRVTVGGALFVMDLEPAEAPNSTYCEAVPAVHLLLSMLGREQHGLGQYTVPCCDGAKLRENIREMGVRFETMQVHEPDLPAEQITHQLVTVGGADEGFGLPLRPRPVILLRSGLGVGDVEAVHGALQWIKHLVRTEPHRCPYLKQLVSRNRIAWSPWGGGGADERPPRGRGGSDGVQPRGRGGSDGVQPRGRGGADGVPPRGRGGADGVEWQPQTGFRRSHEFTSTPLPLDPKSAELGAVIDVVTSTDGRPRVVLPTLDGEYARYARWLGPLMEAFPAGRYFTLAPDDPSRAADRDAWAWRFVTPEVEVIAEAERFDDAALRGAMDAGADVVRIEIPAADADFTTTSIRRIDLAATLIEHVVGLQVGLIAVNRRSAPVRFNGFPPVAPGEALVVDGDDPMLREGVAQVG